MNSMVVTWWIVFFWAVKNVLYLPEHEPVNI